MLYDNTYPSPRYQSQMWSPYDNDQTEEQEDADIAMEKLSLSADAIRSELLARLDELNAQMPHGLDKEDHAALSGLIDDLVAGWNDYAAKGETYCSLRRVVNGEDE